MEQIKHNLEFRNTPKCSVALEETTQAGSKIFPAGRLEKKSLIDYLDIYAFVGNPGK